MLVGKLTYDTLQKRKVPMGYLSPEKDFNSEYLSKEFNSNNERPLKNNLQDLSFKGLSLNRENKGHYKVKERMGRCCRCHRIFPRKLFFVH